MANSCFCVAFLLIVNSTSGMPCSSTNARSRKDDTGEHVATVQVAGSNSEFAVGVLQVRRVEERSQFHGHEIVALALVARLVGISMTDSGSQVKATIAAIAKRQAEISGRKAERRLGRSGASLWKSAKQKMVPQKKNVGEKLMMLALQEKARIDREKALAEEALDRRKQSWMAPLEIEVSSGPIPAPSAAPAIAARRSSIGLAPSMRRRSSIGGGGSSRGGNAPLLGGRRPSMAAIVGGGGIGGKVGGGASIVGGGGGAGGSSLLGAGGTSRRRTSIAPALSERRPSLAPSTHSGRRASLAVTMHRRRMSLAAGLQPTNSNSKRS